MNSSMHSSPIDQWRAKLIGTCSTGDRMGNLAIRSLEVLNCALKEGLSSQNLHCALDTLESDRNITMKYDTQKDSSLRQMIYSLADSIHFAIQSMANENSAPSTAMHVPEMVAPKEEPIDDLLSNLPPPNFTIPPPFPKEEELKLFSSPSIRMEPKMEESRDAFVASTMQMIYARHPDEAPSSSLPSHLRPLPPFSRSECRRKPFYKIEMGTDTVLVCPLCHHVSAKPTAFQSHLRRIHDGVTMNELGIGLQCSCGRVFNAFFALFKHTKNGCQGVLTMFNRANDGQILDGQEEDTKQEIPLL